MAAQDLPRVAIHDFTSFWLGERGQINVGAAVAAMLITEFDGVGGIEILERAELDALLTEIGMRLASRVVEEGAAEAGRLIGVQYFFFGTITVTVNRYRLDIRAVDVETSEVVHALRHTGRPIEELFTDVVSIAEEFIDELDLTPPSERPEVEDVPAGATIAFSQATTLEDRGEMDEAIAEYERTLQIFPDHRAARRALQRLRGNQ